MDEIKNRVAAVVVTYNRAEMLRQCLMSLQKQTMPCDILVVDNASTDDTQALVQRAAQHDASIFYRNTGENLGGAGGFNFGMRWAVEAGYAFVWVMDDDCFPEPVALEKLLDAFAGRVWLAEQCGALDGRQGMPHEPPQDQEELL